MTDRIRTLSRLVRLSLCGVSLMAAGTAWYWTKKPTQIDRAAQWLEDRLLGTVRSEFEQALAEPDPAQTAARLSHWLDSMHHVQRQDHLADEVQRAFLWLSQYAEGRGDLASASEWMEQWTAFHDHSIYPLLRLGDLLCRQESRKLEGVELLRSLTQRFPGHPDPASRLCEAFLDLGRHQDAWNVIRTAESAIRSNLWTVAWEGGPDPTALCFGQALQVIEDQRLSVRFTLGEMTRMLELRLPPFHTELLLSPLLVLSIGGKRCTLDLAAPDTGKAQGADVELEQIGLDPRGLLISGAANPLVRIRAKAGIDPQQPVELLASVRQLPMRAFLAALRMPELGALADRLAAVGDAAGAGELRALRTLVMLEQEAELFWTTDTVDFSADRHTTARFVPTRSDGEVRFSVEFRLDAAADRIRFDLPECPGSRWRLDVVVLGHDRGSTTCDPRQLPVAFANHLAMQDHWLQVTGDDPHVAVRLPEAMHLRSVRIEGVAQ